MLAGLDQDLHGWARAAAVAESWVILVVSQGDSVLGDDYHAVGGHDLAVAVHAELVERLAHVATVQGSVFIGIVGHGLIQAVMVEVARGCEPYFFLGHHEDAVVETGGCSLRLGAR